MLCQSGARGDSLCRTKRKGTFVLELHGVCCGTTSRARPCCSTSGKGRMRLIRVWGKKSRYRRATASPPAAILLARTIEAKRQTLARIKLLFGPLSSLFQLSAMRETTSHEAQLHRKQDRSYKPQRSPKLLPTSLCQHVLDGRLIHRWTLAGT